MTFTLAIGIGATTAVFSVVDAVLLNPLPFPRADRIMTVWQHNANAATQRLAGSPANFLDWRERIQPSKPWPRSNRPALNSWPMASHRTFGSGECPQGFFEILGVPALHGRTFTVDEYQPGGASAVILSYGFWQQQFGWNPASSVKQSP